MMPIHPLGSPDDLFVNIPDVRHGARDAHVPPSVSAGVEAAHRIVPTQPKAYRGPITLPAMPLPAAFTPSTVTDAPRRLALLRIARAHASATRAAFVAQVAPARSRLLDLRDRVTKR